MNALGLGFARVANQFVPTSLANLAGWYDMSQTAGWTLGTGISSLNDLSGNGRHLTQATAGKQPARTVAGQNGRDVATFTAASSQFLVSAGWVQAQPITFYITMKLTANSGVSAAAVGFNGYAAPPEGVFYAAGGLRSAMTYYAGTSFGTIDISDGAFHTLAVVINNTSSVMRKDGTEITGTCGTNATVAIALGNATNESCTEWTPLVMGEFIVYTGAHDITTRNQIQSYLKAKWGTP
jgi:hypothetical protein